MTGPPPPYPNPPYPEQHPQYGPGPQYVHPPQQWPQPGPPPKKKVRVFSWIIVAINALFALWVVLAIAGAASTYGENCNSLDQRTCEAAQGIGATIGVGLIIFVWVAVDIILGIIWLVTRKR